MGAMMTASEPLAGAGRGGGDRADDEADGQDDDDSASDSDSDDSDDDGDGEQACGVPFRLVEAAQHVRDPLSQFRGPADAMALGVDLDARAALDAFFKQCEAEERKQRSADDR